ncbi:hypothetical protein ACF3NA_04860 [Alkanindiges sp. WGS2144]|uniref:hypothetical protein n=1 Tax=Alkanindiges sp. WGS2144 TaxID=3366808 RepID=UPI003751D563
MKNWLWFTLALVLAGCNPPQEAAQRRAEVKPSTKLGTDASAIGKDTYQFISMVDGLLYAGKPEATQLEQRIFQPSRQLLIRWGTEISQKDTAVGDQYTICKGALISLNSWARTQLEQPERAKGRQQVYEEQKQLCAQRLGGLSS